MLAAKRAVCSSVAECRNWAYNNIIRLQHWHSVSGGVVDWDSGDKRHVTVECRVRISVPPQSIKNRVSIQNRIVAVRYGTSYVHVPVHIPVPVPVPGPRYGKLTGPYHWSHPAQDLPRLVERA